MPWSISRIRENYNIQNESVLEAYLEPSQTSASESFCKNS